MYTDPDPQFLAPTQSLEIGQECPFFSTCRPGNPSEKCLQWYWGDSEACCATV